MKTLREIYDYREMIYMLVRRDLRGKYKGSVLGFAWTFINPLLQLAVYTMVFSVVMRSGIDKYYIFLFVALIPWLAMANSVNGGATCIIGQQNLVTKIHFPRQVLPITTVTTQFVNMLLCMVVVLLVCLFSVGLNLAVLWYLIPVILVEYALAMGIAFLVSGLTVYFRDLEHILGIFVMAWQFLSPVMYSVDMVPENLRGLFNLNPMTSVITAYRQILYYKTAPDLTTMATALGMGVLFLVVGWFAFRKLERRFAEEM
ncbi:MAG: ABC transporter permease [Clostridia bacterium]|nr:ABC transporter permease [Clostridia bacterium]